jgi:hypothetical protein
MAWLTKPTAATRPITRFVMRSGNHPRRSRGLSKREPLKAACGGARGHTSETIKQRRKTGQDEQDKQDDQARRQNPGRLFLCISHPVHPVRPVEIFFFLGYQKYVIGISNAST